MQIYKFTHVAHLSAQRHAQAFEYARNHFCPDDIVVMKCPAESAVQMFGYRFRYVVEQCCPSQPFVVRFRGDVIEHTKSMIKIVFVCASVDDLDSFKRG